MDWINKIPKKDKDLAWRIIDGEVVVIPLEDQPKQGEKINVFNETGTAIWKLVDGKNSVAGIIKEIVHDYDVGYEKAESEVMDFLNSLYQKKLMYF